jgi:hypothetical protein
MDLFKILVKSAAILPQRCHWLARNTLTHQIKTRDQQIEINIRFLRITRHTLRSAVAGSAFVARIFRTPCSKPGTVPIRQNTSFPAGLGFVWFFRLLADWRAKPCRDFGNDKCSLFNYRNLINNRRRRVQPERDDRSQQAPAPTGSHGPLKVSSLSLLLLREADIPARLCEMALLTRSRHQIAFLNARFPRARMTGKRWFYLILSKPDLVSF